jgi:hypothetical protein
VRMGSPDEVGKPTHVSVATVPLGVKVLDRVLKSLSSPRSQGRVSLCAGLDFRSHAV